MMIFLSSNIFASNLPNKVLPYMSKGQDVVEVQNALNNLGSNLVADGIYGKQTKNAVLNFQKKHKSLSNDGIYGPATKKILEKALASSKGNKKPTEPEKPNKPSGKIAYLTFDDGPSKNVTPRILKTLDDYNIKATFFMLGNMAEKNPNLVKQVHAKGHSIGNHSYSHEYGYIYANLNNFLGEINQTNKIFKNILGKDFSTKLFRFPGGSFENYKAPYRKALKDRGYEFYDWNALNGDSEANNMSAARLIDRLKETTQGQKELIVLMHDSSTKSTTADSLPEIIEYLRGQGYEFRKLEQ